MLRVAVTIGVLLALLGGTAVHGCSECQSCLQGTGERLMTLQGAEWQGCGVPGDLPSPVPEACPAPLLAREPQDLISRMLRKIQRSTKKYPDPRYLLAMNLAGDNKSDTHDWLLQHIKEEAVEKAHGKDRVVALLWHPVQVDRIPLPWPGTGVLGLSPHCAPAAFLSPQT